MNEPFPPAQLAERRARAASVLDANLAPDAGPLVGSRLEDVANLAAVVDHLDRRLAAASDDAAAALRADLDALLEAAGDLLQAIDAAGLGDRDHWAGRFAALIEPVSSLATIVEATGGRLRT